jgi:hypothetical protein
VASSPPSAPAADGGAPRRWTVAAAALAVALAAFSLYHATLLPGVDFGDTGSFQTTVGTPFLTPRVGYPLYFAIGAAFLRVSGLEPAHALNLVTAIEAALACGLFVIVGVQLSGSLAAAVSAALLFAVSYTFWSQSIIAEVYALHMLAVLAAIGLLLRWETRPTPARLAAFFGCYALGFGNHLSMILLAPAFTAFLLSAAPGGWRSMLRLRIVALAAACALLGASQYLWNLRTLWFQPDPPHSIWQALQIFWFDVTKSDWRDTMVLGVPQSLLRDHAAMYWFDLRQQFGSLVPAIAVAGVALLARTQPRRAVLLALLYVTAVAFAFSYNVGDAHVFYLPSHLFVALGAACAVAGAARVSPRGSAVAAIALAAYAGLRGHRDYPALDRSQDTRPSAVLSAMTTGLDDQRAIFLVDLNWQVANGLSYFAKSVRPELAVARVRDVLLYAPALVHDNVAAGRQVAVTPQAARILADSYGPLFAIEPDGARPPTFADAAGAITPGTRYVVCILKPSRDLAIDQADLASGLRALAGGMPVKRPAGDYVIVAGAAGSPPAYLEGADRPFTRTVVIDGAAAEIRLESWLTSDTIRRMGFGHVIVNHRHTLIVERGISLAAFDRDGGSLFSSYFSNIFAQPSRYLVR